MSVPELGEREEENERAYSGAGRGKDAVDAKFDVTESIVEAVRRLRNPHFGGKAAPRLSLLRSLFPSSPRLRESHLLRLQVPRIFSIPSRVPYRPDDFPSAAHALHGAQDLRGNALQWTIG